MTTYSLNVVIDDVVLAMGSPDSLCIARKVNDRYDVVFQGASPVPKPAQQLLVSDNTFDWTDEYQVFLTNSFANGPIRSSSNVVPINFGETVQFQAGVLQDAVPADTSNGDSQSTATSTFAVGGVPFNFHTVVQQSTGDSSFSTIWVDQSQHFQVERIELTPENQYILFWKNIQTTEAILAINTNTSHTWSFAPGSTEKTIRFGYARQDRPSDPSEAPGWHELSS